MRKFLFATVLLSALSACSPFRNDGTADSAAIVGFDSIACRDSVSDFRNSRVVAIADITFPSHYKDKETSSKLQQLFAREVLTASNDSDALQNILSRYTATILEAYKMPEENAEITPDMQDDTSVPMRYEISRRIKPVFSNPDIISFRKETEIRKDGKTSIRASKFISLSLAPLSKITVGDLFKEDCIPDLREMLKNRLMQQEHAESPEQLIDMGYFNIDNLNVTDNFSFSADSIRFCYEPFEIACYAIGETEIAVAYEELKPFLKANSVILRYIQ